MRLAPSRSTRPPPTKPAINSGSVSAKVVRPVCMALPVVWSTNQGMATEVIILPTCEIALAVKSATSGARSCGWLNRS